MNLTIRNSYSFETYAPAILGAGHFKNCKLVSILDHNSAAAQLDTAALHSQVFPYLPVGTPDDPTQHDYVKFQLPNGDYTILSMSWIIPTTLTEVTERTITVVVKNTTMDDVSRIARILKANGYSDVDVTVSK